MYVNEDSKFLEVEDMKIHYRDVGEGPVVILVHGLFSSLQTWMAGRTNCEATSGSLRQTCQVSV